MIQVETLEPSTLQPVENHALGGLTPKQYRFVTTAFSGMSYADAYREVYDCDDMDVVTIGRRASEEIRKPLVAAKLRALRVAADQKATQLPGLNREFVLNGIMDIAINGERENNRLAAYVWLGKSTGIDVFREITVVERRTRTPEDVDKELRAKIQELMTTIDGTSRPVAPAAAPGDRRRKPKP